VRQIARLFLCDPEGAQGCRQEVERLQMQHGSRQFHQGATLECETIVYCYTDDLLSLRRLIPELEAMARVHLGWKPWLLTARAHFERVCGRPDLALPLFQEALALCPGGRHPAFIQAAAGEVEMLVELGRAREALQRGYAYVAVSEQQELGYAGNVLARVVAAAEAATGELGAALLRIDRALALSAQLGLRGLIAGALHEARARLALAAGDEAAFQTHLGEAQDALGYGRHGPLTARLVRLLEAAKHSSLVRAREAGVEELTLERIAEELGALEAGACARRALELILLATGARGGHLYAVGTADVRQLASHAAEAPPEELEPLLRAQSRLARSADDRTVVLTQEGENQVTASAYQPSVGGFEPVLLPANSELTFMTALRFHGPRLWPAPATLAAIGAQLAARFG
jgi:hypothetical protein